MLSPGKDESHTPTTGDIRLVEPNKAAEKSPPGVVTNGEIPDKGVLEPLCNVLVETEMAETTEEAIKLLEISSVIRDQSYKKQLSMGLSALPWILVNTILDTGAGSKLILKDALVQFYRNDVRELKPKWSQSAADAPPNCRKHQNSDAIGGTGNQTWFLSSLEFCFKHAHRHGVCQ